MKRFVLNAFYTVTYHDRFKAYAPLKRTKPDAFYTVGNLDRFEADVGLKRIAPNTFYTRWNTYMFSSRKEVCTIISIFTFNKIVSKKFQTFIL